MSLLQEFKLPFKRFAQEPVATFSRMGSFLARYLPWHPLYVLTYAFTYFMPGFVPNARFYSLSELKERLAAGASFIRLGDGELILLLDLHNPYQDFNSGVKRMIRTIAKGYHSHASYVLAIPNFITVPNRELRKNGKLHMWLPVKIIYSLFLRHQVQYADTLVFYYDHVFEKHIAPLFKDRQIILVTKKSTILKQQENPLFPWKEFRYVEAPEHNAHNATEDLRLKIDKEITSCPNAVLFFALGPTGKFLMYEYANKNIQSIDIGKAAETMFTGESIEFLI